MAAESVFVFPPDHARPDGLSVLRERNCITLCVYFENFEDPAFQLDSTLQQRHDEHALSPQVMFVRVGDPETDQVAAWQKLNELITFRTLVVVEFVDVPRFQSLVDRDVRKMLRKFHKLKQNAVDLDLALVQKECLWAQENASDHLTTARDLINNELQNPISASKLFVAGHAFLSSSSSADVQFNVYIDSTDVNSLIAELLQSENVTTIAARINLARVTSREEAEFVVQAVDESFIERIGAIDESTAAHFFVVFLPAGLPTADVWAVRDALDAKHVGFDIVHLSTSSDEADVLAAIDCGLRNAKQSLLATKISRIDPATTAAEVTQDDIDKTINDALKSIREIKRA